MKITTQHYKKAYELGRLVHEGKMRPTDAKAELVKIGLNANSGSDLIYNSMIWTSILASRRKRGRRWAVRFWNPSARSPTSRA